MRVPAASIGYVAGSIAGAGLVVLFIMWARSAYIIEGKIEVDLGTHRAPARGIEVRLIERAAEGDMTNFVGEYEAFMQQWPPASASQLFVKALERIGRATNVAPSSLDIGKLEASGARTDSRTDIEKRVAEYKARAQSCREMKASCSIGGEFYDQGARYWEAQAERAAKDGGGITYTTRWVETGGLGKEPVQIVSVVGASAPAGGSARNVKPAAKTAAKTVKTPLREGGIVPGSSITTSEVAATAAEFEQALRQEHTRLLRNADETLLSLTLATATTDENGRYVFADDTVQPGHYIVFTRFDTYSSDNEQMSFMWFQPVDVAQKRFAFSRNVVVDLDNINQRKPQVLDIKVPMTNDLFTVLADRLRQYNLDHPPSP